MVHRTSCVASRTRWAANANVGSMASPSSSVACQRYARRRPTAFGRLTTLGPWSSRGNSPTCQCRSKRRVPGASTRAWKEHRAHSSREVLLRTLSRGIGSGLALPRAPCSPSPTHRLAFYQEALAPTRRVASHIRARRSSCGRRSGCCRRLWPRALRPPRTTQRRLGCWRPRCARRLAFSSFAASCSFGDATVGSRRWRCRISAPTSILCSASSLLWASPRLRRTAFRIEAACARSGPDSVDRPNGSRTSFLAL
mmetsp:Transcript_73606/g.204571  ORF Transcript_73606/g.204571 Transcript_73606/m.204571 type:complete len:254 (-) Transcript_73606:1356-2117(-)